MNQRQDGFMILLAVLIVGAVSLAAGLALLVGGADSSRSSLVTQQNIQARQLADACAEEALAQLQANTAYIGTASLTLGNGSCNYTVVNPGGTARTITSSGTSGNAVRRLQLNATIGVTVSVTSWTDTQ